MHASQTACGSIGTQLGFRRDHDAIKVIGQLCRTANAPRLPHGRSCCLHQPEKADEIPRTVDEQTAPAEESAVRTERTTAHCLQLG